MREGMRTGDQRYLMERDKGPVKAFVRDYVDVRISFMEYLLPVLVLIMVLQFAGRAAAAVAPSSGRPRSCCSCSRWRGCSRGSARRSSTRFPEENARGWRFYALMRAIQLRPLRMPKPRLEAAPAPAQALLTLRELLLV